MRRAFVIVCVVGGVGMAVAANRPAAAPTPPPPPIVPRKSGCTPEAPPPCHPEVTTGNEAFEAHVKPILVARCQPCHFPGGKMYARMPFDRAATIRTLGTKLFTRIQDPAEQATIRAFLAERPAESAKPAR